MRRIAFAPLLFALSPLACEEPVFNAPSTPLPVGGQGGSGNVGGVGGTAATGGTGGVGGDTGGNGGSGNDGGFGGSGACGNTGASVTPGDATRFLIKGTIAPMTAQAPFVGEVLVENGTITCVAASCSAMAAGATVIDSDGYVFPGMIDAHNHVLFDIFDEYDWAPAQTYTNHNQWPNDEKYGAMVDAKQHLNGEAYTGQTCMCGDGACKSGGGCGENSSNCPSDCVSFGCEMMKYGELKAILSGTTSVLGAPGATAKPCYASLARSIDISQNGLGIDKIQTATPFPSTCTAKTVCGNFDDDSTDSYVVHIAEGVDLNARDEFDDLGTVTDAATTIQSCSGAQTSADPNCLYAPQTTIVHGTALDTTRLDIMAANGMQLVWSPKSNVFLYGAGSDLTKTTNIPYAKSVGINVALAPDWSLGGSQNLLEELKFADMVDDQPGWNALSHEDLARMVTVNAAKALALDGSIGTLEVGKKADIMIVDDLAPNAYDALLLAGPKDVVLTMVGGVVLYGDDNLEAAGPAQPGCEALDVCCRAKFVCVATTDSSDLLDQTLGEITQNLETALQAYDDLDVSQWNFMPLSQLVRCQ